jgi:hypothetical protein
VLSAQVVAEHPREVPLTVRTDLPPSLGPTKGLWVQVADRDPVFVAAADWWDDPPTPLLVDAGELSDAPRHTPTRAGTTANFSNDSYSSPRARPAS